MRRIPPQVLASISKRVSDTFNEYYDPNDNGGRDYWMPGRSILPDRTGHTDVLVWIPPFEKNPKKIEEAFADVAKRLRAIQPPRFWPGTGIMMGGTSPVSDDFANHLDDATKRDLALLNYQRIKDNPDTFKHTPQLTKQYKLSRLLQLAHSPAGTGAVVRGVFYPPGKMMPNVVAPPVLPKPVEPDKPKKPNWIQQLKSRIAAKRATQVH
jgi:hypothetical protein